jgi:hypothetical protein
VKRNPGQASPSIPDFALLNPGYARYFRVFQLPASCGMMWAIAVGSRDHRLPKTIYIAVYAAATYTTKMVYRNYLRPQILLFPIRPSRAIERVELATDQRGTTYENVVH